MSGSGPWNILFFFYPRAQQLLVLINANVNVQVGHVRVDRARPDLLVPFVGELRDVGLAVLQLLLREPSGEERTEESVVPEHEALQVRPALSKALVKLFLCKF